MEAIAVAKKKRFQLQGRNNRSRAITPPDVVGEATLCLCQISAAIGAPSYFQLTDPDTQVTFAAVVAVTNDPEKLQQLDALVKSWSRNETTGDHP